MSLLDEYEEPDFTGKVRRTSNGRPYVLADPNWIDDGEDDYPEWAQNGFTLKPTEPRGPSALYTRVTTYISCLEDTYNLGLWEQRMVALGLAMSPALFMALQNVDPSDPSAKDKLDVICSKARDVAQWKEKADLGTAFHDLAEFWDTEHRSPPFLSPKTKEALDAYIKETDGWEYAEIESGMVNDELRTYGTPDRLRYLDRQREYPLLPKLRVTDIKTGRLDFGQQKMAMQLAVYAHSALYDPDTGVRTALDIDQDIAEIVHVPQGEGTCTVWEVDIASAWKMIVGHVPDVRAWRSRSDLFRPRGAVLKVPAEPLTPMNELTSGHAAAWPKTPPEVL